MSLISFDASFVSHLRTLLHVPSPSGYTDRLHAYLMDHLRQYDVSVKSWVGNGLELTLPGQDESLSRGICSHYDTLGLYILTITKDGRIRPGKVGGYPWTAVEGEYVTIHGAARDYRGTVLYDKSSTHIHGSAYEKDARQSENMWVRLDEDVKSDSDVRALGLEVGDFISLDTRLEILGNGYIKGRHLDNKAGVSILLCLLEEWVASGRRPFPYPVRFIFTAGEEIGRGALFVKNLDELLIVDNAVVGEGQESQEKTVSICVRDSTGPFDSKMIQKLRGLSRDLYLGAVSDIYRSYGSDAELVTRRGENTRTALIGPGISASHSYERSHLDAMRKSFQLAWAYLTLV